MAAVQKVRFISHDGLIYHTMSQKKMVNLDAETLRMKSELQTIDGWNFSYLVRELIRTEYNKAIKDGKLVPLGGKVYDISNNV